MSNRFKTSQPSSSFLTSKIARYGLSASSSEFKRICFCVASLLVEIQHQPCHNQCLTTARCHVEKHLRRLRSVTALEMRNKVFKRLFLIWAQLEVWVQVLRNVGRENSTAAVFTQALSSILENKCSPKVTSLKSLMPDLLRIATACP